MFSQSDIKHLDGNAESVEDVAKMSNGLTTHEETVLTPEERMAEKKFIRKVDLTILPLITIMYFLASLVSNGCNFNEKCNNTTLVYANLSLFLQGSRGYWKCCHRRHE